MAATKTDPRAELVERLVSIGERISARTSELADIERRQLAAAAAGEPPDRTLSTAKAALVDEQHIDGQARAAVQGEIDQLDAAERHVQQLAKLARTRQEAASRARAAQEAADAFPAAFQAAEDAVRAAATDLCARLAEIERLTADTVRLNEGVQALAHDLGELAGVVGMVDHVGRLSERYSLAEAGMQRARVFTHARRTPEEAARELAVAAFTEIYRPPTGRPAQGAWQAQPPADVLAADAAYRAERMREAAERREELQRFQQSI